MRGSRRGVARAATPRERAHWPRVLARKASIIDCAAAGWSRGTMWPASKTRRKLKPFDERSSPAALPAAVQFVTGAALNSAVCVQFSASAHAWLPSQLQM